MGNAGNSVKSVQNDREGRQPGISEQRIKLVVPRLPRGHESSKTPEFSSEWMVINVQQAVQKLSWAGQNLAPGNPTQSRHRPGMRDQGWDLPGAQALRRKTVYIIQRGSALGRLESAARRGAAGMGRRPHDPTAGVEHRVSPEQNRVPGSLSSREPSRDGFKGSDPVIGPYFL